MSNDSYVRIYHISSPSTKTLLNKTTETNKQNHLLFTVKQDTCQLALKYTFYHDLKIIYFDKIDSTGLNQVNNLATLLIQAIIKKYQPNKVFVYCATMQELIFKNSGKNQHKRLKTNMNLIKWWINCLSFEHEKVERFYYIPGKDFPSTKNLLKNQWKFGLYLNDDENIDKLYLFDDDLITKTVKYMEKDQKVLELKSVMEAMENDSRAILTLLFDPNKDKDTIINKDKDTIINKDKDTIVNNDKDTINNDKDTIINNEKDTIINKDKDTIINKDKDTIINKDKDTIINKDKDIIDLVMNSSKYWDEFYNKFFELDWSTANIRESTKIILSECEKLDLKSTQFQPSETKTIKSSEKRVAVNNIQTLVKKKREI
jgi:hypothetical protein